MVFKVEVQSFATFKKGSTIDYQDGQILPNINLMEMRIMHEMAFAKMQP